MPDNDDGPRQYGLFDPPPKPTRRTFDLRPRRKRGSPGPIAKETEARDAALDLLESKHSEMVAIARDIAIEICRRRGRVTSVEVFAEMRAQGYDTALDMVDPRWMGAVFREDIWIRSGFETTGSHRRPVAIWKLDGDMGLL